MTLGPSDDQTEEQVARQYLLKIDEALGELTLDEVRQVVQELEARIMQHATTRKSNSI